MQLGKLLLCWMENNKLTVRALAKDIGIDHSVLHHIMHGKAEGSSRTLARIIVWMMK